MKIRNLIWKVAIALTCLRIVIAFVWDVVRFGQMITAFIKEFRRNK